MAHEVSAQGPCAKKKRTYIAVNRAAFGDLPGRGIAFLAVS
jgi:hypothetical protein